MTAFVLALAVLLQAPDSARTARWERALNETTDSLDRVRGAAAAFRVDLANASHDLVLVRAAGTSVVEVREGEASFEIVLPVDLGPSSYPVSLEIRDAHGRVVFTRDGIREAYRDRFLFVECARSDFPDGDYVARATLSAAPGTAAPAAVEFGFRVARAEERR